MKCLFGFSLFLSFNAFAQTQPKWFNDAFKEKGLDKRYELCWSKPAILLGDFNGDKKEDAAVRIIEKGSNKKGVLIIHNSDKAYYIFGAGKRFGSGGDNYSWIDKWSLYTKTIAYETQFDKVSGDILGGKKVKLARPGILVEDFEDGASIAGGIIYWDGRKYRWIHQGE